MRDRSVEKRCRIVEENVNNMTKAATEEPGSRPRGTAEQPGDPSERDNQLLFQEYERAVSAMDQYMDRVLRVAGIGFSAAGALIFLAIGNVVDFNKTEWSFWIAPLILTLFYAIIIQLLNQMTF